MNHAGRRSLSRYGMEMTDQEQAEIGFAIEAGEGKRLSPRRYETQVFAIRWPRLGCMVPVVYQTKRHFIVTVLPACRLDRGYRFHELDVDWLDLDADDALDASALADLTLDTLRSDVANDILAVKLKEALQHAR